MHRSLSFTREICSQLFLYAENIMEWYLCGYKNQTCARIEGMSIINPQLKYHKVFIRGIGAK